MDSKQSLLTPSAADRHRAIFESAIDFAIIATDMSGRITDWNTGAESIFGWNSAEMLGQSAERFFTPEDRAAGQIAKEMRGAAEAGRADDERWHLRKDGTRFWASGEMMALRAPDGSHIGYLKILRDRTTQREEEAKRAADTEFMRGVLASSNDCIKVLSLDAELEFMSEGGKRVMEVSDFNLLRGCSWPTFWEGAARGNAESAVAAAKGGGVGRFQGPADTAAGNPRYWDVQVTPIPGPDGKPAKLLSISRDITEQSLAEKAVHQLNETLERQVEERTRERDRAWKLSRDLQVVIDELGEIKAVNDAWPDILGWSSDDLIGRNFAEFVLPDDAESSAGALAVASKGDLPWFENRYRHKDGGFRWFAWVSAPHDGLIYASGRHITALKEAEASLETAREQLRQSQKMEAVGQLTGGLAHDFNNLLASISGSVDLLGRKLSQGQSTDLGRYIEIAKNSVKRAAALTHRMLAFSRRQTLEPKPTDPDRLIAGMDDLIRRAIGPEISFEVVGAAGVWTVNVDPHQLENALLNLCINARDAMPDGGRLTIETANKWLDQRAADERQMEPGQYVSICVTDSGIGMDAETKRRIFEPFFTTKPIGVGTGLGLSMVHGFAAQSGGQVRAYSELGMGTTMCIYLPRHHGVALGDRVDAAVTKPGGTAIGTVLVVDDEAGVRLVMRELIEEMGYSTLEADNAATALEVLRASPAVDLLVTDVGLPGGMNGRQLAQAARLLRTGLKVLFVTGYAENSVLSSGQLEPGMQLLSKPFEIDAFVMRVNDLMSAR